MHIHVSHGMGQPRLLRRTLYEVGVNVTLTPEEWETVRYYQLNHEIVYEVPRGDETYFADLGNFRRRAEFWYSFETVHDGLAWIEALKTKYLPSLKSRINMAFTAGTDAETWTL